MKNFLMVLNIVLVLAVGTLFYLFFTGKNTPKIVRSPISDSASPASFKIVYFESDSLERQYEYYKEVRDAIRKQDEENARQLTQLKNTYINKAKAYQQGVNSMSQTEQVNAQQELQRMEVDYQNLLQQQQQEIQTESMRKLQAVKMKIQDFLKDYAKEKGYAFVFGTNELDFVYYKDSTRDITNEVVRLLNERYLASKPEKKK